MRAYLAGPEVFFPDSTERITQKRALAERWGFEPVSGDGDGDGEEDWPADPVEAGVAIYRHNEVMMRRAQVGIANVSPFRGISADPGTVWEVGFMTGIGMPVFAYSTDPRDYNDRAAAEWYRAPLDCDAGGLLRAPDGQMVEAHGMADNLMIDGCLLARGVRVVRPPAVPCEPMAAFEACLAIAAQVLGLAPAPSSAGR